MTTTRMLNHPQPVPAARETLGKLRELPVAGSTPSMILMGLPT